MRGTGTGSVTASPSTSLVPLLLPHDAGTRSCLQRKPKPKPPSFLCLKPLLLCRPGPTAGATTASASASFPLPCCSLDDSPLDHSDSKDDLSEDGVCIQIQKLPNNSRRIVSSVAIQAPLSAVWTVLTDYERLPDFIPGLALSQLLDSSPNYARLFQVGEQNLAFGLKFNARGIIDCYEKQLETLPSGRGLNRDIEFNMVEGDFQFFQGKWSILQLNKGGDDDALIDQEMHTTLSYLVDVKPKLWLPVQLVEARLCKEIKVNLACIREEAHKAVRNTLHTL